MDCSDGIFLCGATVLASLLLLEGLKFTVVGQLHIKLSHINVILEADFSTAQTYHTWHGCVLSM